MSTSETASIADPLAAQDETLAAANARMTHELDAMKRLHAIATRFVHDDGVQGLLGEIVEAAIAITGADMGNLRLLDEERGELRIVAQRGFDAAFMGRVGAVPIATVPSWTHGLLARERTIIVDIRDRPSLSTSDYQQQMLEAGVRGVQATPLVSWSGKVLGLLITHYRVPRRPDDRSLPLLDLLARQAADILERDQQKRAIEELREAERRTQEMLQTVADPVIILNETGYIEYANTQALSVFGYAPEEMVGQLHSMLVPERLREIHAQMAAKYLAHPEARAMGRGLTVDLLGLRKDGTEFPVEVSLAPIRTSKGVKVSTVLRDATERKRFEAALRIQAERLESAIESIPDPVAISDAENRLALCNSAFRRLISDVGPPPQVGTPWLDIIARIGQLFDFDTEEERRRFFEVRFAARFREADAYDVRLTRGRVFRVAARAMPGGGRVTIAMDLTEELRREREIEAARSEAEAASRAKSEFLASMSHELRTPLNAVLGFAQLLLRDKRERLTERQREMVHQVYAGGDHLLRLIDDVLDLARLDAKGISVSPEPVSVPDAVSDVMALLKPTAAKAGVALRCSAPAAELPSIDADRFRYVQILMNLASNGIKYNRHGGTLTFTLSSGPGWVRVAVTDTGIGIAPEHQSQLFQPFFRAGQETGPIEGTGIGLAISKRLAEMMGGAVGFRSTLGVGSEFWVDVPAHPSPPLPAPRNRDSVVEEPRPAPVQRALVLYVEDHPPNVALMADVVSSIDGVELVTATTAEDGLEIARRRRPDVIVMDIHLPRMNGIEVLQRLRGWEETRGIPVIALTAAASPADRERGLEAGFQSYLVKPVRIEELESALESALS